MTATVGLAAWIAPATIHGAGEAAEKIGVIVLALLAAVVVLSRPPRIPERTRALAMLAALVLTPVLLLIDLWHAPKLEHLRHHPALVVAAVVAAALVVAAMTVLFRRRPQAFPLAVVLTVPFRVPITTEGSSANLLIPLYLVIGAAALAEILPALLAPQRAETSAPGTGTAGTGRMRGSRLRLPTRAELPRLLEWTLMASVVLYALQATYSADFTKSLENTVFFYVPFSLLLALLRRLDWTPALLRHCFGLAVAIAVVLAGIGFVEEAAKRLLLNHLLVTGNAFNGYFRVNSLFYDPNIYGRFLALVMIGVATIVLARPGGEALPAQRRTVIVGALILIWLWAGLVTSFSQSSIAALLLGLAVLAAWRWNARKTVYVSLVAVALAAIVFYSAPASWHFGLHQSSERESSGGHESSGLNNATNGRENLVKGGLSLFADRPLEGFGSGSFATEYKLREHKYVVSTTESHTTPVTVAAEQGVIGVALYVALLLAALGTLFDGARRSAPRILIGACFAALVLQTFVYADFLEDPITWLLLAVGLALAAPWKSEPAAAAGL